MVKEARWNDKRVAVKTMESEEEKKAFKNEVGGKQQRVRLFIYLSAPPLHVSYWCYIATLFCCLFSQLKQLSRVRHPNIVCLYGAVIEASKVRA